MSQVLSNLAVGSKVKFGSYSVNGEAAQSIVWTIVAKNHTGYPSNSVTLHTSEIIDLRCFDAKEPNNADSNRQNYGNNRYSVSNIDQWLNKDAAGGEWYSAAHSADHSPDNIAGSNSGTQYANHSGFLSGFTNDEKVAILSTTIRVVKPSEDGGSYEDIIRKVFLPSTTELGLSNENSIAEGAAWGYYTSDTARIGYVTQQCFNNTPSNTKPSSKTTAWYWWLRTPRYSYTDFVQTVLSDGSLKNNILYNANYGANGIRPALNLSNTLKVSDTTDSDGCYTFMWPSHPMPWVGGTETYTENETRNVEVSMESTSDILTSDRQNELWDCKYYHENSSTGYNDYMNFNNSSLLGMSYKGRYFSSDRIGTVITTKITFLKAISNIKISRISWQNDVEYYKNDTTLETDIIKLNDTEIYTITATKEQYGNDYITIANDITIGNVSVGDILSFETKKEGTLDSTSDYKDLTGGLTFYFSSDPITLTETVQVQKTRGINKPVSSIYAGVTATVPVYTETTTTEDIALSSATFTDFFAASNTGTTGTNAKGVSWTDNSGGGLKLKFGNYGINSSTSMTTFTAQRDLTNVVIKSLYYTETRYDKITLTVAGTTVLNAVSGTSSTLTQRWTGSLSKGQTIVLKFVKDSSQSASSEKSTYFTLSCDPYQKTTVNKTQTGTETKLVDKKIVKGYVGGPDGKARLFFGENKPISYTGEYTEQDYTDSSGVAHKIYTLTTSGELKLTKEAECWLCGGGSSGSLAHYDDTNYNAYVSGVGGAGGQIKTAVLAPKTWFIQIGVGGAKAQTVSNNRYYNSGGETRVQFDIYNSYYGYGGSGISGGSGGGGCGILNSDTKITTGGGQGKKVATYPFGLTSFKPHAGGGGGGGAYYSSTKRTIGGNGGTGGSDGSESFPASASSPKNTSGGSGGEYGGGNGGGIIYNSSNALISTSSTDATFYGSGGGGGAVLYKNSSNIFYGSGGAGYQGVVYIAIPPITTT